MHCRMHILNVPVGGVRCIHPEGSLLPHNSGTLLKAKEAKTHRFQDCHTHEFHINTSPSAPLNIFTRVCFTYFH